LQPIWSDKMKFDKVYLKGGSKFSEVISTWVADKANEIVLVTDKFQDQFQDMDSLLIINENQNLLKEIQEIKAFFDKQQKAIHKIDINGTLMVGLSSLGLWIESSKVKRVYIAGSDELLQNPNLQRYLNAIR
jgi:hypothetical protein